MAVIAASVALAQKEPVVWESYLPLPPLGLLWLTGVYLFVLPDGTQWGGGKVSP